MGEKYVSREPDTGWTAIPTRLYRFRIPRMHLSWMPPMFSRGQRRDETPSDTTIHERTLRPNHEKEILYRKSRNEMRVYVGTRIQRNLPKRPGT